MLERVKDIRDEGRNLMPQTYIQDTKGIIDSLSIDKGLILEEKLVLLAVVNDYVAAVTRKLEDELETCRDSLIQ